MSGGYNANDEIRLLSAVTLTTSYTDNTTSAYEFRSTGGITLLVNYTANGGSLNAFLNFVVEFSYDSSAWIPYSEWTLASAGLRLAENTTFKVVQTSPTAVITLDESRARYVRVKAKESSVTSTNFGLCTMYAYPHSN